MKKLFAKPKPTNTSSTNTNNPNNTTNNNTGKWSWNNGGNWTDFENATSLEIDNNITSQLHKTSNQTLVFPLSKGTWFSQSKNRNVYFCHILLDPKRAFIKQSFQLNTHSNFTRQMHRTPPFAISNHSAFTANLAQNNTHNPSQTAYTITCTSNDQPSGALSWQWMDNNGWKAYDDATISQIEIAYSSKNENGNSVNLNCGPYFGRSNVRNVYRIEFNRLCNPNTFTQMNSHTHFQRKVRRIGGVVKCKDKKHEKWRSYYRPMTIAHFTKLSDKDRRCLICFADLESKELLENQSKEFKKYVSLSNNGAIDNDEADPAQANAADMTDVVIDDDGDSAMNESKCDLESKNDGKSDGKWKETELDDTFLNAITDETVIYLSKCATLDHYFHSECIARWLDSKGKCCHCHRRYAIETGNQPNGQLHVQFVLNSKCQGFDGSASDGTIHISFEFEGGIQNKSHYHPGQAYSGDYRDCYFPNCEEGREALELTRIAFERKLIFTIGRSLTNKCDNRIVWGSLHFKTRMNGGQLAHGYPDDTYFKRFKEELQAKGVTTDDFDKAAIDRINYKEKQ